MAVKQNFTVKAGLEVADSATVGGVFKASEYNILQQTEMITRL